MDILFDHNLMVQRRKANMDYARGTLALEGLRMSPEAEADGERYIQGELALEECIQRTLARHKKI